MFSRNSLLAPVWTGESGFRTLRKTQMRVGQKAIHHRGHGGHRGKKPNRELTTKGTKEHEGKQKGQSRALAFVVVMVIRERSCSPGIRCCLWSC